MNDGTKSLEKMSIWGRIILTTTTKKTGWTILTSFCGDNENERGFFSHQELHANCCSMSVKLLTRSAAGPHD